MNCIALEKPSAEEIDSRMRLKYVYPIDIFPIRIEQLMQSLTRVCRIIHVLIRICLFVPDLC